MLTFKTLPHLKVIMLLLFSVLFFEGPSIENTSGCSYEKQATGTPSPYSNSSNSEERVSDIEECCDEATTSPNKLKYADEGSLKRRPPHSLCHKPPFIEMELRPPKTQLS